jgi:GNAT superfamily N-acetyltransferase
LTAVAVTLGRGQVRSAAEAIAAGHAEYPAFRAVFPDPRRRARALLPFFAATIRDGIRSGRVLGVLGKGRVEAVAVWLPPGAFPWSPWRQARAVPALLRVFTADPRAFPRFARYGANAARLHPSEPHWYLVVLSVRPDVQRGGYGSALVRPALEWADQEGVGCYLETSDPANVAFYERFGFAVRDEVLQLVPDGPPHVSMWRPPSR